jgi:hypothetical protein
MCLEPMLFRGVCHKGHTYDVVVVVCTNQRASSVSKKKKVLKQYLRSVYGKGII